jgi:hypothetical protein
MQILLTAIISAVTSLLVVILTPVLTTYRENKAQQRRDRERVNLTYLNPLRFYLVENHFRLTEILRRVSDEGGRCEALLFVNSPKDVSEKNAEWFNGQGCYLISSCYLTACLFYQMRRVRDDLPFLRLGKNDDTKLMALMIKVSLGFLRGFGVFYLTQPSIGNDMYLREEGRLMSYREFCQLLQSPERRIWFDRLLVYYLETGQGAKLARVENALSAIQELSGFLDDAIGGGESIKERFESEGIKSL